MVKQLLSSLCFFELVNGIVDFSHLKSCHEIYDFRGNRRHDSLTAFYFLFSSQRIGKRILHRIKPIQFSPFLSIIFIRTRKNARSRVVVGFLKARSRFLTGLQNASSVLSTFQVKVCPTYKMASVNQKSCIHMHIRCILYIKLSWRLKTKSIFR